MFLLQPKNLIISLLTVVLLIMTPLYFISSLSLSEAEAKIKQKNTELALKEKTILSLNENIKEIQNQKERAQTISNQWKILVQELKKKIPADVPIVPIALKPSEEEINECQKYIKAEEKRGKEMQSFKETANLIIDYVNNNELQSKSYDEIRTNILSKTSSLTSGTR